MAFGVGYAVATPEGRRQLASLQAQVTQLLRRPEAKQLRERGWDIAGDKALAARNWVQSRSRATASGEQPRRMFRRGGSATTTTAADSGFDGTDAGLTGFTGSTVAEDSDAVITGRTVAPPTGPTGSEKQG